jgi:hypothetical protein
VTKRYSLVGLMLMFAATAAWGCGDDDDVGAPPAGKALQDLTPREIRGLCEQLLSKVRGASTPEQQCVEAALSTSSTTAACDTARKSCLSDKEYQDFQQARCKTYDDGAGSDVPSFDCDTEASEVTRCYDRVATWLEGLRCSQAGKAPEIPSCIDELNDGACSFGLSQLLADGDASDGGSLSCQPGKQVSCLCTDGGKGIQTCNPDGVYEPCDCTSAGAGYECKSGSMTYPYDFGVSAQCNDCATKNCCPSFADCQGDADCACYWDCLGQSGQSDCFAACDITDSPSSFVDHAVCLRDNCRSPCDLP